MPILAESWPKPVPVEHGGTSDVVIVGGGPAGSAAAHVIARAGLKAVLLERGGPNRDKACGDLFLPSAVAVLRRLGLDRDALLAAQGVESRAVDFFGERGRLWRIQYPEAPLWMIPRSRIDQAIRACLPAAVRVLYHAYATDILRLSGECLRVRTSGVQAKTEFLLCRGVVLACGSQNPLPRRWGIGGMPHIAPSMSAYVSCADLEAPVFEMSHDCRPGYRWLFPGRGGRANVGVCFLFPAGGAPLRMQCSNLLRDHGLTDSIRWRGGAGALWSGRGVRWHDPTGIVACGDAAGLIDPHTGEGLTAALVSGEAAGMAMADFLFQNRNPIRLQAYSQWVGSFFQAAYAPSPFRLAWKQLCGLGINGS